jgi:hypothetical protein
VTPSNWNASGSTTSSTRIILCCCILWIHSKEWYRYCCRWMLFWMGSMIHPSIGTYSRAISTRYYCRRKINGREKKNDGSKRYNTNGESWFPRDYNIPRGNSRWNVQEYKQILILVTLFGGNMYFLKYTYRSSLLYQPWKKKKLNSSYKNNLCTFELTRI